MSSGVRGEDWEGVDVVEINAPRHPIHKKIINQLQDQGLCIKDEDSVNEIDILTQAGKYIPFF